MGWDPPFEEWARLVCRYSHLHGDVVAVVFAKGLLLTHPARWHERSDVVAVPVGLRDSVVEVRERLVVAHEYEVTFGSRSLR